MLGAYWNKYDIWKWGGGGGAPPPPPPPCRHCPHSAIQQVMVNPEFSSVIQTHLFSAIGAAMQDKKD